MPARDANRGPAPAPPLRRRSLLGGFGLLACAVAAAALSGGGILGLGLERGIPALASVTVALVSVLLPARGLSTLLGRSWRAEAAAVMLWSCAVLAVLPMYAADFPAAVRGGLSFALSPFGEGIAAPASEFAHTFTRRLVDAGRAPRPLAEQFDQPSAPAAEAEPEAESALEAEGSGAPAGEEQPEQGGLVVLPVEGQGTSLKVMVLIDAPAGPREIELLFDTGATLTTLDRRTLGELGIPIPADSPVAVLQTANGRVESPVVLLERLWLGHVPLDNVSVAVCDSCAQDSTRGLLGLNATSLFDVTMNASDQELRLLPVAIDGDRRLDVNHWLQLSAVVTMYRMGRVEVVVDVENSAVVDVSEAVSELDCGEQSFAVQVDEIPAGGSASTELELPRGTDCRSYRVILRSARW